MEDLTRFPHRALGDAVQRKFDSPGVSHIDLELAPGRPGDCFLRLEQDIERLLIVSANPHPGFLRRHRFQDVPSLLGGFFIGFHRRRGRELLGRLPLLFRLERFGYGLLHRGHRLGGRIFEARRR